MQKINIFVENLGNKTESLKNAGDTIKVYLTDAAPVATNTVFGTPAEITAANGYAAGGNAAVVTSWTQTSGTLKWLVASPTAWTASGGTIGPFRYAVIYDSTTTRLIGWYDYTAEITLQIGDTFTVTLDQVNGVLQIA
jgi:type IV secretory pathway TrbD component